MTVSTLMKVFFLLRVYITLYIEWWARKRKMSRSFLLFNLTLTDREREGRLLSFLWTEIEIWLHFKWFEHWIIFICIDQRTVGIKLNPTLKNPAADILGLFSGLSMSRVKIFIYTKSNTSSQFLIIAEWWNIKCVILASFRMTLSDASKCCSRLATFETYFLFNTNTIKVNTILFNNYIYSSPVEVSVLIRMPVNKGK